MKLKQIAMTSVAVFVGVMFATSSTVQAVFYDRDKLGRAIANYFHLDEKAVKEFLADYQYNPEKYDNEVVVASSNVSTNGTSTTTSAGKTEMKSGVLYEYDEYSDKYYPASKIVSVQHQQCLDFIQAELNKEIARGVMTADLRNDILDKLAEMMKKSPKTSEFVKMTYKEQRASIGSFKREMDGWMKSRGMTLAQLRAITGKGNKYLMGIYY